MSDVCASSTPEERARLKRRLSTLETDVVEKEIREVIDIAKALSDRQRLKLLVAIGNKEVCGCDLVALVDLSQPAVSHHLNILARAGLLKRRRQGRYNRYQYVPENLKLLISRIQKLIKE